MQGRSLRTSSGLDWTVGSNAKGHSHKMSTRWVLHPNTSSCQGHERSDAGQGLLQAQHDKWHPSQHNLAVGIHLKIGGLVGR
eukprot:10425331-Prorocentrum_lima.AAC.1